MVLHFLKTTVVTVLICGAFKIAPAVAVKDFCVNYQQENMCKANSKCHWNSDVNKCSFDGGQSYRTYVDAWAAVKPPRVEPAPSGLCGVMMYNSDGKCISAQDGSPVANR